MSKRRPVHILGGGGHAKVVIGVLERLGYTVAGLFDDDPRRWGGTLLGIPVLGPIAHIAQAAPLPAVIAIGDNALRRRIAETYALEWLSVIDPRAWVDPSVTLGRGTVVLPGALVQVDARLGEHVIVNTAASVDHDCVVGSFVHLAPGVRLAGGVTVEEGVLMGTGAVSIPGTSVGAWTTIGAGATVVRDLPPHVVAMGVPAKVTRTPEPNWLEPQKPQPAVVSPPRVYLSPPHMSPREREFLLEAFDSNWIAPLGPHVDALEREWAEKLRVVEAVAVSSGTAALHLSLLLLGVGPRDEVLTSTLTFAATANAITYTGAKPVFLDSDRETWNMDPNLLAEELECCARRGKLPKAVVTVDLYGQCADYDAIREVCQRYEVPLVEDAAEALGATYRGRAAGTFGELGCFSLNGNKIITASGGGLLVSHRRDFCRQARFLATQARDPAPHYQHSQIGYNYRMSNLLAAVARGQLDVLEDRVQRRRANFEFYQAALGNLSGIAFMPEPAACRSTRWLTCVTIAPDEFGATRENVRLALEEENIESRPVWKPMHLQPVFRDCRRRGGSVAEELFEHGLCLPSGSSLTHEDRHRVVETMQLVGADVRRHAQVGGAARVGRRAA
jgi:sugar O-acyltransferase (sialic acid O-acetyltransferase NeuD family)